MFVLPDPAGTIFTDVTVHTIPPGEDLGDGREKVFGEI